MGPITGSFRLAMTGVLNETDIYLSHLGEKQTDRLQESL